MTGDAPLAGLEVIELARILAGPWAGQILSDLGASVTKIECPAGDDTRRWGPPFVERQGASDAAYFHATNRGKRSVVVDLLDDAQRAALVARIATADVLIENFKVGGLAKYGLDYATLSQLNPRLIYCSITGFGQTGPYAARPGYDFIVQGMSGIMDLTGQPDRPPQKIGVAYADIMTGLYAVIGIQAAVAERNRSGQGQQIDVALLDVMIGTLANQALNYLTSGVAPTRLGNAHPNIVPYEAFAAADGWVIIAVGNDRQFHAVSEVLRLPTDNRFATNAGRIEHRQELQTLIAGAVASRSSADLLAELEASGVPAGPINTVAAAFDDPQVVARKMQIRSPLEEGADVSGVRLPLLFSRSRLETKAGSPALGDIIRT